MKPLDEIIDENFVLRLSRGEPWAFEGQLENKDGNVEPLAGRTFFACVMAADGTRLREAVAEIYTDSTGVFYRGVIDGSMSDDLFGQPNLLWWQGERTDAGNKPDAQGLLVIYPGPGMAAPAGPNGVAAVATRFIRRTSETGRARIRKAQTGARGPSPWDAEGETLEAYNARVAQGAIDLASQHVGDAILDMGQAFAEKSLEIDASLAGAARVDQVQVLSDEQRATARANIGAVDQAALDRATATTYIKVPLRPALAASAIGNGSSADDIARRNDNAALLLAAIAKAKAIIGLSGTNGRVQNKAVLLFEAGAFAFPNGFTALVDFSGLSLRGQGRRSTHFLVQTSAAFIDFGVPVKSIPTGTVFDGTAQDWEITDLAIYNTSYLSTSNHGTRFGSAIRDTGSGHGLIQNVRVGGFGYGVNLVCGSDFTRIDNLYVELNDVGLYVGPGSQQILATNFDSYLNRENLVLDRPGDICFVKPIFNSAALNNVTIEAPAARVTRQLNDFNPSGTFYDGNIAIVDAWYESFAGGLGDATIPDYHNCISSAATGEVYRYIKIVRPLVASGQNTVSGRATIAFVGKPDDGRLGAFDSEVSDANAKGYHIAWWARAGNNNVLRNARGSDNITKGSPNLRVIEDLPRSAQPTSGQYLAGTFIRAVMTAPVAGKVLLGWARLTTGTAHVAGTDWQAVYGSTS